MPYECECIEQSAQPTLVVRRRSAIERLPQVLGHAWGVVMARAAGVGAEPVGSPFAAMRAWMDEHGLEHAGPACEHCLDDPAETPIEQVRTLIVIPVR